MTLADQLQQLVMETRQLLTSVSGLGALEQVEVLMLGRKGRLAELMKQMASVSSEERPTLGALANEVKQHLEGLFSSKRQTLSEEALKERFEAEREDISEPGTRPAQGHLHPMTQAIREITSIFERMGFVSTRCREVEHDWFAFEALNMGEDHPARDEWETFFLEQPVDQKWGRQLLTPHATSGTARHLAEWKPPIRAINIQKTYRRQIDVTHVPMFHQFDGVLVDKGINITHLLGVLDYFVKAFFGADRKTRIRPYHFRFTEPSFEIDISCGYCGGKGMLSNGQKCRTCKRGWLELGGAGMLHPNVLKAAKIDPSIYSGLAFGWGVERTYLMKEGLQLDDLRTLYKNDLRFLQQF